MNKETSTQPPALKVVPPTAKAPNTAIFAAFIAAAVLIDGLLLLVFTNLRINGPILALSMATPLVVGLSVGLTRSGWRKQLPTLPLRLVRVALVGVVVADLAFLVAPLFIKGATAHDTAPQFTTASTTGQPTAIAQQFTPTPVATSVPGPFTFVFSAHTGEGNTTGMAILGQTTSGQMVLRLQAFHTGGGPDLHVFLSRVRTPQNNTDVRNGYDLGALQATDGDKNYPVPTNIDITQIKSVVIYCVSYSAIFGYATLP